MPPKFKRTTDPLRESERTALLDGNSDDDDFFLKGPSASAGRLVKDEKITRVQGQVDEVMGVMQDNIGRVLDRGERLEDLEDKSENLSNNADMFRVRAKGLRNQMWWRECRMRLILAAVVAVILTIIIVAIVTSSKKN